MQFTTTSSSVCGGNSGDSRNAVRESRWLLSTLVSVDAEPYASTTRDSPSKGSLKEVSEKWRGGGIIYAVLTRNSASAGVTKPSITIAYGERDNTFTEEKRCSGHPFRYSAAKSCTRICLGANGAIETEDGGLLTRTRHNVAMRTPMRPMKFKCLTDFSVSIVDNKEFDG
jgi:hypothetical protein